MTVVDTWFDAMARALTSDNTLWLSPTFQRLRTIGNDMCTALLDGRHPNASKEAGCWSDWPEASSDAEYIAEVSAPVLFEMVKAGDDLYSLV